MIVCLFSGACIQGKQPNEAALRLPEVEQQLQVEQTQRQECEKKNVALLIESDKLKSEFESCKMVNQNLSSNLLKLSDRSQKLKKDLQKQKSVVSLQEQVIKLLDDTKKTIESSLKDQILAQGIEIQEGDDQLKVTLVDRMLFDSGSVKINKEGEKLLLTLAVTFTKNKTYQIVVSGHTDNVPLSKNLRKQFPSNWELSAARAASVVRLLQVKGRLDPRRLSIQAYGSYRPVASNHSEAGRAQNRRIEIVLDSPR
jgi:chemotaxis protein MotB